MKISLTEYDAALAEEHLEPVDLEFCGETFTIPNSKLWPDTVAAAISDNDLERVFRLILGPGELERLREVAEQSKVGHLSLGHLEWLMEHIAEALGLASLGESPAGEPTPATIGAPSNPTFNGSTGSASPPASPARTRKPAARRGASPAS